MKLTHYAIAALASLTLAFPVWGHHNSPADPDIGDMMGMHDAAIDALDPNGSGNATTSMDPADSSGPGTDLDDPSGLTRVQPGGVMDQNSADNADQQSADRSGR